MCKVIRLIDGLETCTAPGLWFGGEYSGRIDSVGGDSIGNKLILTVHFFPLKSWR